MKTLILTLFLTLGTLGAAFAAPSSDDAVAASKAWLAEIDGKSYAQSWKDAAALFQEGVSQDKWEGMVGAIRDKLGPLKSRDYQAVKLTNSLPGVPDGDYAIVTFNSSFANKAVGTEVVTLVFEGGHWKAGGYFMPK
jgi:hypothetical protein